MDNQPETNNIETPTPEESETKPSENDTNNAPSIDADIEAAAGSLSDKENVSDQPPVPNQAPKKSRAKVFAFIIVILILAGAVSGYLIHNHDKTKSKNLGIIQNLNVGIEEGALGNSLYPDGSASDTAGNILVNYQIFDGLVNYENQNQIEPDLATGWTTPNPTTWIFTLKSGIKFHDGNTMTPADVVYSLDLLKNQNNDYSQTFATTLKTIQADGPNKVKIVTTQPDPVLLNKLAFLYILDKNLPKGDNRSLAGTGAYELKPGTSMTNNAVHLVAVKNFHGGQVLTKNVNIYHSLTYASLLNGFKTHKYDIAGQVPTKDQNLAGSFKYVEQDNSVDFLGLNTTSGPLSNKLVRQAMQYALNPVQLAAQADGIKATAIGQLIPPSIPGYNPSILPVTQNIAKAKQLMAEAGYANGVTLNYAAGGPTPTTAVLVDQLKQIGITLNIDNTTDLNDMINNFINGKTQIVVLAYSSSTLDGADVLDSTIPPADFSNPEFFKLVNQATTTINPSTRLQLLEQAETIVQQNVPAIPLFYDDNVYLMDKRYVIHQDLPALYTSVYFYKVHL
jgi:peptide/nickel transport system substrate-binding protein